MLFLKRLRGVKFNWIHVTGEVFLIFIGITLSLVFDEWRDERSNRQKQHELLVILRKSIQNDLNKLDRNIKACEKTIKMHQYIFDHLNESSTVSDSLSLAFSYIGSNPSFTADMSGYKTIEAIGLITIHDNEMRSRIIDYYQVIRHYEKWGENVGRFLEGSFTPYVLTHFEDYEFLEKGMPYNLNEIRKDRVFMNVIKKANKLTRVTLEGMEDHRKYAAEFIELLPKE